MKKIVTLLCVFFVITFLSVNSYAKYVIENTNLVANINIDATPPKIELIYVTNSNENNNKYANKTHTIVVQFRVVERNVKKYDLQLKQMQDTQKRDAYRIWGELLNTYGYDAKPGAKSLEAINYYTNEKVTIPLDPNLTATENAKKYFEKYGKLKRTYEALSELTREVKSQIDHLESISTALDIALSEADLAQIREELAQSGYIRKKGNAKKAKLTSRPLHYISSDGFHIYVGKNNLQNDQLTFQFASGNDWWFHAKGIPGSHVIVKTEGEKELPDRTFEEAGSLAAYYSKGRGQDKVEIDYVQKKQIKKPAGAKPGFVVYYTNYSLMAECDISALTLVND